MSLVSCDPSALFKLFCILYLLFASVQITTSEKSDFATRYYVGVHSGHAGSIVPTGFADEPDEDNLNSTERKYEYRA